MGLSENELRATHSEKVEELQRQLREKEDVLKQYRSEHGKLELFFDSIRSELKPLKQVKSVYEPKHDGTAISSVIQISDSHMGEVQSGSEIEGFNEYSPDICRSRNIDFIERFLSWLSIQRAGYNIPDCTVLITGDLIAGDIHDELRVTNAFPVPVQIVEAAKIHARQLALLAPHFENVNVHYITEDNHSRLTKKTQAKEAGKNNYNYVIAELIGAYIKNLKNINFNVYPMLETVVQVCNTRYLICHGHNVRGWMGVPWYGIERKVGKEAQSRMRIIMGDVERAESVGFDKYVFGHFHTPINTDLYSGAGSVSGTNAYDHQSGRFSQPSQPAWLVHRGCPFNVL